MTEIAKTGGGLFTNRTGTGKTVGITDGLDDLMREAESKARNEIRPFKLSWGYASPRRSINQQVADMMRAINVTSDDHYQWGELNRWVFCFTVRLGREEYRNGAVNQWGDIYSYDESHLGLSAVRKVGSGMPSPTFFCIDEFRQTMEGFFLGVVGSDKGLFTSGKQRLEIAESAFRMIQQAVWFYGMDAQLGKVEHDLLTALRGNTKDTQRIVASSPKEATRVMRWTGKQADFRSALIGEIFRQDRIKPVMVVTGRKGQIYDDSTRGLSAWNLSRWVDHYGKEANRRLNIVVVDSDNKDKPIQQEVFKGNVDGVDLVILTPCWPIRIQLGEQVPHNQLRRGWSNPSSQCVWRPGRNQRTDC